MGETLCHPSKPVPGFRLPSVKRLTDGLWQRRYLHPVVVNPQTSILVRSRETTKVRIVDERRIDLLTDQVPINEDLDQPIRVDFYSPGLPG